MKNMKNNYKITNSKLVEIIKNGGVGVLPTDTLYGLVGSALNKKSVEKIYKLRKRNSGKPFIILISSLKDLNLFEIKLEKETEKLLKKLWPGKVSVILACVSKKLKYLHRGTNSLAFRIPKNKKLINLLKKTGPLAAPSANHEGKKPASTITEAKKYFGNKVDFYVDGGILKSQPSTLVEIRGGKIIVLRQGAVKIK